MSGRGSRQASTLRAMQKRVRRRQVGQPEAGRQLTILASAGHCGVLLHPKIGLEVEIFASYATH